MQFLKGHRFVVATHHTAAYSQLQAWCQLAQVGLDTWYSRAMIQAKSDSWWQMQLQRQHRVAGAESEKAPLTTWGPDDPLFSILSQTEPSKLVLTGTEVTVVQSTSVSNLISYTCAYILLLNVRIRCIKKVSKCICSIFGVWIPFVSFRL